MADENQTTTTNDVGPSEEVNTSTNGETQDTDVELEDIEVSEDELDDDTEEPDESTDDEAATESKEEDAEEPKEDVKDEEPKGEDTASEDTSESDRKRLNDEMAKRRIAEKQLREAQQQREQEQLQRYLDEAGDDETELAKRQLQVEAHNIQRERVALNTQRLETDIDRAVADIDLFRTGSPEIKEELAASLDDFERMYVRRDDQGNPIDVQGDVYQYLQAKATSIRRLTGVGARQETQAKTNAKSRTDTVPTRAPKEPKVDQDLADFDAEFDRY